MGPARQEAERHWREHLADAKLQLDFAHNYLVEIESDLTSAGTASANLREAYEHALRALGLSVGNYLNVLKTLSDVAMHGRVPEKPRPAVAGES